MIAAKVLVKNSLLAVCCSAFAATTPLSTVEQWVVPGVSSAAWESHPAIDPWTGDLWFVRSDRTFSGWQLFRARCVAGRWDTPNVVHLAGNGLEADPWFSKDGRTLWFISTGQTPSPDSTALDVWRMRRIPSGAWSAPERLSAPVNSAFAEWFPRLGPDEWLYFGSRRPGGLGKDDIWRARVTKGHWIVENAGAGLNTAGAEYEFVPAPEGTWGVLATDHGIFRITRSGRGWRRAERYAANVNANGSEIGPMMLPNGRGFVFSRDAGGNESGELFIDVAQGPDATPVCSPLRQR